MQGCQNINVDCCFWNLRLQNFRQKRANNRLVLPFLHEKRTLHGVCARQSRAALMDSLDPNSGGDKSGEACVFVRGPLPRNERI